MLHRRSERRGLDATISERYDWSVARQLTSFPLSNWNLRNVTLQTCLLITRDSALRLRSAGSLAINSCFKFQRLLLIMYEEYILNVKS